MTLLILFIVLNPVLLLIIVTLGRKYISSFVEIDNAIKYGRIFAIDRLIRNNQININLQDNEGQTLLCKAVRAGQLKVVQYLINHGADVNIAEATEVTPLILAVIEEDLAIVKILVESRALIEYRNKFGRNVIYQSLLCNNPQISAYLAHQISPHLCLHHAVIHQNLAIIQDNCYHYFTYTTDQYGWTPLHEAAGVAKDIKIIEYLIRIGSSINAKTLKGQTPLDIAKINHANSDVIKMLQHE